jgi:hypothetical protein
MRASSTSSCLSGRGEHHARLGEEVVRNSGVDFTLVRAAWFAQNFSEGYLRDPILAGVLPMPGGDIAEPIIDIDDIADVAVAALTEEGHKGKLYEVTGPRLMTFAEMAEVLGQAIGRPIQHIPISFEDFHANVAGSGWRFVAERLHRHRPRNARRPERPHDRWCDAGPRPAAPRLRRVRRGPPRAGTHGPPPLDRRTSNPNWSKPMTPVQKLALGVAGITSLGIGAFILAAPTRLLRKLRDRARARPQPAERVARPRRRACRLRRRHAGRHRPPGAAAGRRRGRADRLPRLPGGRVLGLAIDGMPSGGILGALVLELAIAGFCLFAFRRNAGPAVTLRHALITSRSGGIAMFPPHPSNP